MGKFLENIKRINISSLKLLLQNCMRFFACSSATTLMICGVGLMSEAQAFPCYITLVKDNCWANYALNVAMVNVKTGDLLATIVIPAGKSWVRHQFVCQPKDTLMFKATYSPVFWEADRDKVFSAKRYWSFPAEINKGDKAWNMTLCYASDFAETPLPPESSGHCICNKVRIPVIE